tara:strand:+ start:415 stop:1059 length:645 start_codon:yes stop_codon:yes gene_type:complete
MSIRKVGGIGTRKDGSGGFKANLGEGAKFITVNVFADDGMSDSSYEIKKGDAVCLENRGTAAAHLTIGGSAVHVVDHFGFSNVARLLDAAGQNTAGNQAGATGSIADAAFCIGIAAETKTISKDTSELLSVQVWGQCEGVNVRTSTAIGERLVAETAAAVSSIGRLQNTDTLIGGNTQADIRELADVAIVGVALSAESSNTCTVWLLDPLQLAN